jgi:peptide/nickel transport system permease protein
MLTYTIRRLLLIIPTLVLVTVMVFLSVRFIPGDVIDVMVAQLSTSGEMSTMNRAVLLERLGLDAPVHIQYARWVGALPQKDGQFKGVIQGDLGTSIWKNQKVTELLAQRMPVSTELGFIAILTALLISIPIGIYSAIRQDTLTDYLGRSMSILFISVPSFWIATMVIMYPAIWWGWSPNLVYIPFGKDFLGNLWQFIIPGFILGMAMGGTLMRVTRTMMLEVVRQDYIRTAWAKGLTERNVIWSHALKNAFIPVVTIIGVMIPIVIGGTIIIESIFNLPGVGLMMFEALTQRDYPVISGINLVLAIAVLLSNLAADLAYASLDPRVKYS